MRLLVLGLNHRTAPVHVRESFAVASETVAGLNARFGHEPAVAEAIVLSTCNRVELWLVPAADGKSGLDAAEKIALQSLPPSADSTRPPLPATAISIAARMR
jgi:glutamyl-tRNA reductase